MATPLSTIETIARRHLLETTAKFWTSAEMIDLINLGAHDLWRSINDLKLNHFCTRDTTNVSLAANATSLTGVPADCVRVHMIEPRDLSDSSTSKNLVFSPIPYNDLKFQGARGQSAQDASGSTTIFWTQIGAGGPVSAPTILVAPALSSAVNLAFTYVPILAALTSSDNNPIPGESDNALVCWTVAYARAKEREDRAPDAGWLQLYATEKANLIKSLAPRQDQDPEITGAMFESYWE